MNANPTEAPGLPYSAIFLLGAGLSLVAGFVLGFLNGGASLALVLGLFFGYALAALNLVFLSKIVAKMLNQKYTGASRGAIVFIFLKLGLIAGVFYLSFWVLLVDPLAFIAGYLGLMLALSLYKPSLSQAVEI
jgi:hypothetical protein